MRQALIIDAVRSPMGRGRSTSVFGETHPAELLAQVLRGLVERNKLDPGQVDDVIIGCVSQSGEQSATPGRVAWLAAGFPEHVPSTTVERKCGSGQQAIHFGAQAIMAGVCDIVIAGGVESMSRVPMGSARMDKDPFGPSYNKRYHPGPISQGIAAERVAGLWNLSRTELDTFSARSHQLAEQARVSGLFDREIVPIQTLNGLIDRDETIRVGTTPEQLSTLNPVFTNPQMAARFPEINEWRITAGNSSQISDGASAMLLMSEDMANRLGMNARARFVGFDVIGDDPTLMLTAPIPATKRVLQKSGLAMEDIDLFEVNEAFAPVPLAWLRETKADPDRLNVAGGAIALGHPLGASGTRIMSTLLSSLEARGGRYGLQTICEAGGMANATIIERL